MARSLGSLLPLLLAPALLLAGCTERELPTALAPDAAPVLSTFSVGCSENRVAELIAAIEAANDETTNPGVDVIELAAGCTYTLTSAHNGLSGLPVVTSAITIEGNGAALERSTAGGIPAFRLLYVESGGDLTLTELTLRNGDAGDGGGGAIVNRGTLELRGSTVTGNSGFHGGGLQNGRTLTIRGSTISGNNATRDGGGIYNPTSTLTIENCTLSGNTAGARGGGIFHAHTPGLVGEVTLRHVTVTNNAARQGGGVFNPVFDSEPDPFRLAHSLIAGNTDTESADGTSPDVHGPFLSEGYNLIGNSSGASGFDDTDLLDVDAGLDPVLRNNGGPTETHALETSPDVSPAIDAIPSEECTLSEDQRGVSRPQGSGCDIGAFELVQQTPPGDIADLLEFFEAAVDAGTLVGTGSGASAASRLNALRNMLLTAADLLAQEDLAGACGQLLQAERRTDGEPQPPDFVSGEAAPELAEKIAQLREDLGCS